MQVFTSNSISLFCEAQTLSQQQLTGSRGPFEAYTVGGNTYPLRIQLKALGFSWWPTLKVWYIPANKFNEDIRQKLTAMGVTAGEVAPVQGNAMQVPQAPVNPVQQMQAKPAQAMQTTEDADLTRWYGFPINHKIAQFDVELDINGEKHVEPVTIDRLCVFGGETYHKTKSREGKLHPKYVVSVGNNTLGFNSSDYLLEDKDEEKHNRIGRLTFINKEPWGSYNEAEYIERLKGVIKQRIDNNPRLKTPSKSHFALTTYYDYAKRQDDLKQLLAQKKFKRQGVVELAEGGYAGKYDVEMESFVGEQDFSPYVDTAVDHPMAKRHATLGSLPLHGVHTVPEFDEALQKFCASENVRAKYLEYLKSFPFLEEQQINGKTEFDSVKFVLEGGLASTTTVFKKLIEMGYVRANKRQGKDQQGAQRPEDIKWVLESKKISSDVFSYDLKASMPSFLYTVIAYNVYHKVRGNTGMIAAMWMDDAMRQWKSSMDKFGLQMDRRQAYDIIEELSDAIVSIVFKQKTREQQNKEFTDWFNNFDSGKESEEAGEKPEAGDLGATPQGLEQFKQFAEGLGLETGDIKENAKNIYRNLTKLLHPDLFPPEQKAEKEAQFKNLQAIWDKVPVQYKQASSWYLKSIISSVLNNRLYKTAEYFEMKEQVDPLKARAEAKEISRQHPGKYVTIRTCFGLFVSISDRLHVFAPSDAHAAFKFYYLNGIEKPFSKAQTIRDQNLTPTMN